jgi:hypothetical protein
MRETLNSIRKINEKEGGDFFIISSVTIGPTTTGLWSIGPCFLKLAHR